MEAEMTGVYCRLAEHLDRLPGGFAPSTTGAELRLLALLFTPREAELATHVTLDDEPAGAIAARAGLPADEAARRLEEMAHKGLIFAIQPEQGPARYHALPFVVGIYEMQVNNLTAELRQALDDYWSSTRPRPRKPAIPQMRTIPIGESLEPHLEALPYEQAAEMVRSQDRMAVGPCICRRHARLAGGGCDAPEETCLSFGEWADYAVRAGTARAVSREEVLALLAQADAAGLVLQPGNSQDASFICCCCKCCCGVLQGVRQHPRPAEIVVNAFAASLAPELCSGCWTCLERCPMDALTEADGLVALKPERCIGCGLCVSTCPSGALTLARKPEGAGSVVPADLLSTWRIISRQQATGD